MPLIAAAERHLYARSFYGGDISGGAQWAFVAIALVVFALTIFGTIRVNKRRSQAGVKPIYGTRWMTPPSYYQSQSQGAQPAGADSDLPGAYVPAYTAHANADDMGYFSADGTFHANPNAKTPVYPEIAHPRTTTSADGGPIQNWDQREVRVVADEDLDFTRPTGPPPGSSNFQRSSAAEFERPYHPPPAR